MAIWRRLDDAASYASTMIALFYAQLDHFDRVGGVTRESLDEHISMLSDIDNELKKFHYNGRDPTVLTKVLHDIGIAGSHIVRLHIDSSPLMKSTTPVPDI